MTNAGRWSAVGAAVAVGAALGVGFARPDPASGPVEMRLEPHEDER